MSPLLIYCLNKCPLSEQFDQGLHFIILIHSSPDKQRESLKNSDGIVRGLAIVPGQPTSDYGNCFRQLRV